MCTLLGIQWNIRMLSETNTIKIFSTSISSLNEAQIWCLSKTKALLYSDKISDFHFIVSFSYQKVLLKIYDYLKIVSKWIILETWVFSAKTPQKNTIHHHFIQLNLSIIMLCLKIRVFSSKYFILKKIPM